MYYKKTEVKEKAVEDAHEAKKCAKNVVKNMVPKK